MKGEDPRYAADLHTHTIASGHAYGTVMENAQHAAAMGLSVIAMTDHGPAFSDSPGLYFFQNMRVIPKRLFGVRVLKSVEANIIDIDGKIDVPENVAAQMELIIAGFHHPELGHHARDGKLVEFYTHVLLAAIANPLVDIIAHPGNPMFPIQAEEIVRAATACGKALEINNNSFVARPHSIIVCKRIASLCAEYGTYVSIASDAHFPFSVGDVSDAAKLAIEAGIKREQIINASVDSLRAFLETRGRKVSDFESARLARLESG